jgi:hypothetical protein
MRLDRFAIAFVLVLCLGSVSFAQADKKPAPAAAPAAAPKAPALDESDALAIQVAQLAALRANDACAVLETTKNAQSLQQQVLARFDKKYPGYTVDLAKGVLVAKAAQK